MFTFCIILSLCSVGVVYTKPADSPANQINSGKNSTAISSTGKVSTNSTSDSPKVYHFMFRPNKFKLLNASDVRFLHKKPSTSFLGQPKLDSVPIAEKKTQNQVQQILPLFCGSNEPSYLYPKKNSSGSSNTAAAVSIIVTQSTKVPSNKQNSSDVKVETGSGKPLNDSFWFEYIQNLGNKSGLATNSKDIIESFLNKATGVTNNQNGVSESNLKIVTVSSLNSSAPEVEAKKKVTTVTAGTNQSVKIQNATVPPLKGPIMSAPVSQKGTPKVATNASTTKFPDNNITNAKKEMTAVADQKGVQMSTTNNKMTVQQPTALTNQGTMLTSNKISPANRPLLIIPVKSTRRDYQENSPGPYQIVNRMGEDTVGKKKIEELKNSTNTKKPNETRKDILVELFKNVSVTNYLNYWVGEKMLNETQHHTEQNQKLVETNCKILDVLLQKSKQ